MNLDRGIISRGTINEGITALEELKEAVAKISKYHGEEDAARLECLVAKVFGHILHLPVYSKDYRDQRETYRVDWPGSHNGTLKKVEKGPDAFVYAHGFTCLMEATSCTGNKQWSRHFGQVVDHLDDFLEKHKLDKSDVYSIFIAGDIARRSYISLRQTQIEGLNTIPLQLDSLAQILEPSIFAFAQCHYMFRDLLEEMGKELKNSENIANYLNKVKSSFRAYRTRILESERILFLGFSLHEVFIKDNRNLITLQEIWNKLQADARMEHFCKISGRSLTEAEIEKCLLSLGLARKVEPVFQKRDPWFEPTPTIELRSKVKRILNVLEEVNGDS